MGQTVVEIQFFANVAVNRQFVRNDEKSTIIRKRTDLWALLLEQCDLLEKIHTEVYVIYFKLEFTSALLALNNGLNKFLQPFDGKDSLFGTQSKINTYSMLPVVKLCPAISSDYSQHEQIFVGIMWQGMEKTE